MAPLRRVTFNRVQEMARRDKAARLALTEAIAKDAEENGIAADSRTSARMVRSIVGEDLTTDELRAVLGAAEIIRTRLGENAS